MLDKTAVEVAESVWQIMKVGAHEVLIAISLLASVRL